MQINTMLKNTNYHLNLSIVVLFDDEHGWLLNNKNT